MIVDFPFFDFIYTKKTYRQQKKTNHTFHAYLYAFIWNPRSFLQLSPSVGQSSHWFVDNFFLFFWDYEMNLIKQVRIFYSLIQFHLVILLVIWKFLLGTNDMLQNCVSSILSGLSHLLIRARGCLFKVWWGPGLISNYIS